MISGKSAGAVRAVGLAFALLLSTTSLAQERRFSADDLPKIVRIGDNKGARYASDNFWMMGDTGPCGPCSEIHFNLLPSDEETAGRELVNSGSPRCIEIWNHVFIQFNANPDGTFSSLPAKHVDTGMGFERVTSIIQGTKGFSDFANAKISNYETDIFRPIFDRIAEAAGAGRGARVDRRQRLRVRIQANRSRFNLRSVGRPESVLVVKAAL